MSYIDPTIADFKTYFVRDFPFGNDIETDVLDSDITKAMNQTAIQINQSLFCSQEEYDIGFLLLSAHNLVMNIRASSQGLSGQFAWLQNSRSVGSVSESLAVPENITQNPLYSFFTKTNYGAQYLMLIFPTLMGQVFTVQGGTTP